MAAAVIGLGLVLALAAATPTPPPPTLATATPRPRFPGFAAQLADQPVMTGPKGWPLLPRAKAWEQLANSSAETRQAARWAYVRSLIGNGFGLEARGVLAVMRSDDPDLALVPAFQLATGVANAQSGDGRAALAALGVGTDGGGLAANPEACAWRMRALVQVGEPVAALSTIPCALPALNARATAARAPFLYAGAGAALAAGRPAPVAAWLQALPDKDPAANLYRAKAAAMMGNAEVARLRFGRVQHDGNQQQRIDAEVSLLEAALAAAPATPSMIATIDRLAFVWRGDSIERRVLQLDYRIGRQKGDLRRSLTAGATLVRYFRLGTEMGPLLTELQALLAAGLAADSKVPLVEAAGLYWDYRDLAPAGAEGDFLASQLADRLQAVGLYARAAELLRHQLIARTTDLAQGPLSARVGSLFILAGQPSAALAAIRATEGNDYPADMTADRRRVEAVALYKLGRRAEALATLQDVPDAAAMRAEIFWKAHDWAALATETAPLLPDASRLNAVQQALVLRHAIALAMLGHEPDLARLRARYTAAFVGLPGAATFDVLTRDVASLDPEAIRLAMLSIPAASPVGDIGALFDAPLAKPAAPTI